MVLCRSTGLKQASAVVIRLRGFRKQIWDTVEAPSRPGRPGEWSLLGLAVTGGLGGCQPSQLSFASAVIKVTFTD